MCVTLFLLSFGLHNIFVFLLLNDFRKQFLLGKKQKREKVKRIFWTVTHKIKYQNYESKFL